MHKIVRVAFLLAAIQLAVLVAFAPQAKAADREVDTMDTETAERFARLALDCIEREYPNLIHHVMTGDDDARAKSFTKHQVKAEEHPERIKLREEQQEARDKAREAAKVWCRAR